MCGLIAGLVVLIVVIGSASSWLEKNPWGSLLIPVSIGLIAAVWYLLRKSKIENNMIAMERIADELEVIVKDFADIDGFLVLRKGEKAIYQRMGV